jgi:CheY-like chemotaxis protein
VKNSFKFLWIDDDPERIKSYESVIKRHGRQTAELDICPVKNKDVMAEVPIICNKEKPDLVIIDHVFSNAGGASLREGSTVARALREKWNDVPIIGVTAALKISAKQKHFDRLKTAEYIELFDFDRFDSYVPELYAITTDFKKVVSADLKKSDTYLDLLKSRVDRDILTAVLPSDFKTPPDASTAHAFARWTIHTFMDCPGFLYDEPRTATLLGISQRGFNKVKKHFVSCLYSGVFSSESKPRWWPKLVREKLFNLLPKESSNLPWIAGRNLPRLSKADFSKCAFDDGEIPDTMAYPDEKSEELQPVCMKHTIPHPRSTTNFGFEELRIFKPS